MHNFVYSFAPFASVGSFRRLILQVNIAAAIVDLASTGARDFFSAGAQNAGAAIIMATAAVADSLTNASR